jgi:alkaline phosphatase D
MRKLTRREFVAAAAAMGASVAWGAPRPARSRTKWVERRARFAQGVASGDPAPDSVLLWTRVSDAGGADAIALTVEVAEDEAFLRVVASAETRALAAADHTCRVLVGGLLPARTYYYRFSTASGDGSRVGRTRTAAAEADAQPVRFAFVSCQNVCEGAQNAYRRMIFEDGQQREADQLAFVLHLGDFVYEVVEYPEDRPEGKRYDRRLRYPVTYPQGEKVLGFHVPVTVDDYRALYRAYLEDPDLQDARARWAFVPMWDNHEFSWMGWQSVQVFRGDTRPAQTKKVAANQAWFEYQPARIRKSGGASLERFEAPAVKDAPLDRFDGAGLSQEPNNLAAVGSLTGYRALRWGRLLDLVITDQHSYRSEEPSALVPSLASDDFPELYPEEEMRALDAGRALPGGVPRPPQTILGAEQKAWFLERLRTSSATWKVWGNSMGTLDWRADPQNLPAGTGARWPHESYACFGGGGDYGTAYAERGEIYDAVARAGVAGFVTVSGDRHSFWAGLSAKDLPPRAFEPVGVAFVTGSVSAPGLVEAFEHRFPKDHPLRPLYVADLSGAQKPAVNVLLHHGVRACLEYQKTGDLAAARRASNPDVAPHLSFVDMGGHGYAVVHLTQGAVECTFVCLPRPLERSATPDGGPLRYRVVHRAALWAKGERPRLLQSVVEGDPETAL